MYQVALRRYRELNIIEQLTPLPLCQKHSNRGIQNQSTAGEQSDQSIIRDINIHLLCTALTATRRSLCHPRRHPRASISLFPRCSGSLVFLLRRLWVLLHQSQRPESILRHDRARVIIRCIAVPRGTAGIDPASTAIADDTPGVTALVPVEADGTSRTRPWSWCSARAVRI